MLTKTMRERIAEHVIPTDGTSGLLTRSELPLERLAVVGLGATVRHAKRSADAMRDVTVDLIEHHQFRAVAIEGTGSPFNTAAGLDRYVTHGEGDPLALIRASQGFLHAHEIEDLIVALRAHNQNHPEELVRIVHDNEHREPAKSLIEVEHELSDQALTWRAATGHRIVHWGGAAHVVAGEPRGIATGGEPDPGLAHRNAGGHLRSALGSGYAAVAVTVGAVDAGAGHAPIPAVASSFSESPLNDVPDVGWLATRGAPAALVPWLDAPLRIRCVGPAYDPLRDRDHFITAPRVRDAVDAFLHVKRSTVITPL